MIHKILTGMLTLLITISGFSAYGTVLNDCHDPTCCCCQTAGKAAEMETGQNENRLKIQAPMGCCCGEAAGSTCSLKTLAPFEKIGWALSPNRLDLPFFNLCVEVSMDDARFGPRAIFQASATPETAHQSSPHIYLSAMSFLC